MSRVGLVESWARHIGGKRQKVYWGGTEGSVVVGESKRRTDLLVACLCPTFIAVSGVIPNTSCRASLTLHLSGLPFTL